MSKTRTAEAAQPFSARSAAEAAIYPTPKPVSNRFFQNSSNRSANKLESLSAEPAASREATKSSQALFQKKQKLFWSRNTWNTLRSSLHFEERGF